jgi:Leucine-rich repeat (LRR) protein
MTRRNKIVRFTSFILLFFILAATPLFAQKSRKEKKQLQNQNQNQNQNQHKNDKVSTAELDNYKLKIKLMIGFLEYIFNTVGSDSAFANDKETIINTSYLKIFQNDKVQVEDDLVEDRKVVTNKNVQAYLRDIDYFFKDVKFELKIENISENLTDKNRLYFVVTLNRHLKGTNIEDQVLNTNTPRYVEINLDPKQLDLKIVSIYTNKISEEEDLNKWWLALPSVWKEIFAKEAGITDSTADYGHLKRLINTEEIDLHGNTKISDLEPLNKFIKLKKVNFSNTNINSLLPLRNLTHIEVLTFNSTPVVDLEPLKYFVDLKAFYADSTNITSLEPLRQITGIEILHCSKTPLTSLEPLNGMTMLKEIKFPHTQITDLIWATTLTKLQLIDFSDTKIADVGPLAALYDLRQLYFYSTGVADLKPLENLKALFIINFNNTPVGSLVPLSGLPKLEKIYCDKSKVSQEEALAFAAARPGVLVICGSEESMAWWSSLSAGWKNVFIKKTGFSDSPTREQLAVISNIEKLDISGQDAIQSLSPLKALHNLKELRLNNSPVKTLDPIANAVNLLLLEFAGTQIGSLDPLWSLNKLTLINCDNTKIDSAQANRYLASHPKCVVIYKTNKLNAWWKALPSAWQATFKEIGRLEDVPTSQSLHKLIYNDTITIDNKPIASLAPLTEFIYLKSLHISNTQVSDLSPLKNLKNLKNLTCTKNPVKDLTPLQGLNGLEYLDIENTAVEDLDPLEKLTQLNTLKCPGTQVSSLNPLEKLGNLSYLDCSNTRVGNLNALTDSKKIKTLVCFNTHISKRQVTKFSKAHPECIVSHY